MIDWADDIASVWHARAGAAPSMTDETAMYFEIATWCSGAGRRELIRHPSGHHSVVTSYADGEIEGARVDGLNIRMYLLWYGDRRAIMDWLRVFA